VLWVAQKCVRQSGSARTRWGAASDLIAVIRWRGGRKGEGEG